MFEMDQDFQMVLCKHIVLRFKWVSLVTISYLPLSFFKKKIENENKKDSKVKICFESFTFLDVHLIVCHFVKWHFDAVKIQFVITAKRYK